ncbi:MAG: tyrosine-type recombinase/integrase [Acidobacteriaceae bacterium]|nr:tyrosine-type recombinase/integrase [Acidobacteriaceae bacterium]
MRPSNPVDAVEAPRPAQTEMTAVDEARAAWLIQAAEGTPLYLAILMALCTGMRRGEILGLRWKDLDLENAQ